MRPRMSLRSNVHRQKFALFRHSTVRKLTAGGFECDAGSVELCEKTRFGRAVIRGRTCAGSCRVRSARHESIDNDILPTIAPGHASAA
jgi:hypothetical protein